MYKGEIPWSDKGILHYPEAWRTNKIRWRENKPMVLRLAFSHFARGRSAAYAVFKECALELGDVLIAPDEFPMFLTDFGDLLRSGLYGAADGGTTLGTFVGCKRGMNYGIAFVPPELPERYDL